MVFRVSKLVAVITGGSKGLGFATARRIVRQGGKVTIIDRSKTEGEKAAEQLGHQNCVFCLCDVTKTEEVQEAVDVTIGRYNGVHVLVNCVGTSTSRSIYNLSLDKPHPTELFEDAIDTNVIGTFNTIRCFVPLMAKNTPDEDGQRGVIINTSSIFAVDGRRGQFAHSSSKAAISAMTLPLAREFSKQGIRTVTIAPSYFDTPNISTIPEKVLKFISHQSPYPGRLGKPDEYAMLAQTIIENSYLNGTVIRLDGAMRAGLRN